MSTPLASLPPRYQAQINAQKQPKVTGHNVAAADALMGIFGMKRIRQKQGDGMNKTERAFLAYLKSEYPKAYIHREMSLPLANGCRYKLDFMTVHNCPTGAICNGWEVKGFMRDDAAVKLKVAASVYPWINFTLVSRKSQKSVWEMQRVQP